MTGTARNGRGGGAGGAGAAALPGTPTGAQARVAPAAERASLPAGSGAVAAASRVTVLAPRTRVDVALPPDVPLADLLPVLLDMTGESAAGARGGGWTLAPLGQGPVDPSRTLAALGVLDGDQLVLRRRADAAPPPLFDDVVDAVAEATPASYRAWGPGLARVLGLCGLALGLAVAVLALVVAGRAPGTAGGLGTAAVAGVAALGAFAAAIVGTRVLDDAGAGSVLAVGAVALAGVVGVAAVPWAAPGPLTATSGAPQLLLGAALAAVTAATCLLALGSAGRTGVAALLGVLTAAVLLVLAAGVATVVDAGDAAGIAAGAGALALVASALLPRTGIALAHLPLPRVPGSAEELADDPGVAEHADIERRADRAHAALSGLVVGCGAVTAGAVAVVALAPASGWRGVAGWVLAALLTVLLGLRSRTYANGVQAVALLVCALLAGAGLLVGWLHVAPPLVAVLAVPATALAAGALALVLGVVVPRRRFSPVARRAVDVAEAVGIAAVLPIALAVMDLYTAMRLL
ncbi:type VII secretion integral membrane protein EccD [Actinomycetospora straminea]|uniref:type VII secretion integral membrane protein EccD n=1 Tax=Actinomycetospora straminea TaxID=663607 RepID=UPI0023664438|nr:type VII secretion integral membrane protein EccD [Actinomycetospora straminea]MDD7931262.1 type VII secretion integral membrane protein EccD [Actinomycetospora straminea]